MPVPQKAIFLVGQASCLPLMRHRQDGCSTRIREIDWGAGILPASDMPFQIRFQNFDTIGQIRPISVSIDIDSSIAKRPPCNP
ncbi:hypothetical protein [Microcoleus sp. N3A4]|uniref:hypothetical protein n=1 Tax=Microcoleus sp. N3A4 TaxID=3055379 RepID=UPI002FD3287D